MSKHYLKLGGAGTFVFSANTEDSDGEPTLPTLPTSVPASTIDYDLPIGGTTHTPANTAELEALFALSGGAVGGDVIVLDKDVTYAGTFVIEEGDRGAGWIYVHSSGLASLPAEGTRVTPSDQPNMATIQCTVTTEKCLYVDWGTARWRFVGIEFESTYASTAAVQYGIVRVGYEGTGDAAEDIVFDRCYIHGTATGNLIDGITFYKVIRSALLDSHVSEVHGVGYETHGVNIFGGQQIMIRNNYVSAAGICMFIGDNVLFESIVPADIEIIGCRFYKPFSWWPSHADYAGIDWLAKNILEFKACNRSLVSGCILDQNWVDSQKGYGILMTPRAGDIHDITIQNCMIRKSSRGIFMNPTYETLERILIDNVLIETYEPTDTGTIIAFDGSGDPTIKDVTIRHLTGLHPADMTTNGSPYAFQIWGIVDTKTIDKLKVHDLILTHVTHGWKSVTGQFGLPGTAAMTNSYDVDTVVMIPGPNGTSIYGVEALYTGNFDDNFKNWAFPATMAAVGFVDTTFDDIADFALAGGSDYKGTGTGGTDPGCNITTLLAALNDS